ncbi:MAG: ThuA domain-containing protein, partial [Planctomycetota bacterium]|nr:ThuA domain-containing protein [Planctomycetota bacterium]
KPGEGYSEWPEFDSVVLGGNYHMHHGNKKPTDPKTSIRVVESAQRNPLVSGLLPEGEIQVNSWLYKTEPLAEGTTVLVSGRVGERTPHEPVAWTYINPYGARVFYTSLGHEDDFDTEFFGELLKRSLLWTAGLPHALAKTIKPSGAE